MYTHSMFRNKRMQEMNAKRTGTAVVMTLAVCLMTVAYTGCYFAYKTSVPKISEAESVIYSTSVSRAVKVKLETEKKTVPTEETVTTLQGSIDEMKREISSKYSVNILTGKDATKDLPGNVKSETVETEARIVNAINTLVPFFERFGKRFFEEFRYGTSKGLNLLMVGRTYVTNYGETTDADGAAFKKGDAFYLLLNINSSYTKLNFCHELMHAMEQNSDSSSFFPEWNNYNPTGFKYGDSVADHTNSQYTTAELEEDDIYFYDTYAKKAANEDRARIFEYLVGTEKRECTIHSYPRIEAKAKYMKKCILKRYPSLKDTNVFRNLDA